MEDLTGCERARSSKETREPSSSATNIGNYCPLTKIRSKENGVWNHSMVYVESLNSDSLSLILTLFNDVDS
jgi:hypothetical protein